ncbi:acyl--CoA ligase [bacterium]|nr:acyl--CoA ligase [bacterium]
MNIADHCIFRHAANPSFRDKAALIFLRGDNGGDEIYSYGELAGIVGRFASSLARLDLRKGDRLLIRLDNSVGYALAFFGALRAGLVPIPSSPQFTPEEVAFQLRDSGAKALVVAPHLAAGVADSAEALGPVTTVITSGRVVLKTPAGVVSVLLDDLLDAGPELPPPAIDDEDPAYLIYTSGTTARSKGVLHAHRSARGRDIVIREWEGVTPDDRVCHAGVLNWTYTLGVGLMDPWSVGATAVLYGGPRRPQVWAPLIERMRVTIFAGATSVFRQILKYTMVEEFDLSSLRHGLTAAEPLLPEVYGEWKRRVGCELYEALGMTEISTYISFKPGDTVKPGACGRPQAGRRIRLAARDSLDDAPRGETGRIVVHRSDPGLMLGYWRRPDEEALVFDGDWFVTGDLGLEDEDGVWWYRGRLDDQLSSFGYRVSPVEVEEVVRAHPDVHDVAVTVVSRGAGKDIITGLVILEPGRALNVEALHRHCHEHLAHYKCPKEYVAVAAIPRSESGKVLRRKLADLAGG